MDTLHFRKRNHSETYFKSLVFFGKNNFLRLSNEVEDKQKIIFSKKTPQFYFFDTFFDKLYEIED